jgi:hypothetical protein
MYIKRNTKRAIRRRNARIARAMHMTRVVRLSEVLLSNNFEAAARAAVVVGSGTGL